MKRASILHFCYASADRFAVGGTRASCGIFSPRFWAGSLGIISLIFPVFAGETSPVRPETEMERTEEYDYDVPVPGTYSLPPLLKASDGIVSGPEGTRLRLLELMEGRITVLSFIYTRCPDPRACPMATGALRQVHALTVVDPTVANDVLLATMSFDPAFDTPEVMKAFGKANRSEDTGAPWLFLTAPSKKELNPILNAYGQVIHLPKDDPAQKIKHPVRVYLIDRKKQVRNIYSFGLLDPRMVMTDIRTLLMEEEAEKLARGK